MRNITIVVYHAGRRASVDKKIDSTLKQFDLIQCRMFRAAMYYFIALHDMSSSLLEK